MCGYSRLKGATPGPDRPTKMWWRIESHRQRWCGEVVRELIYRWPPGGRSPPLFTLHNAQCPGMSIYSILVLLTVPVCFSD